MSNPRATSVKNHGAAEQKQSASRQALGQATGAERALLISSVQLQLPLCVVVFQLEREAHERIAN